MVTPKYNGLAGPKFDMLCAKVLWMMGDCRSPVVKTRTQNLLYKLPHVVVCINGLNQLTIERKWLVRIKPTVFITGRGNPGNSVRRVIPDRIL